MAEVYAIGGLRAPEKIANTDCKKACPDWR
jgi:hypothetical protein